MSARVAPLRWHAAYSWCVVALVVLAAAGGVAAGWTRPAPWMGSAPGGSWLRTALALQTNALVATPGHPGVLFAATGEGVWRSGDRGVHWTQAGRGLRTTIMSLALSARADTLFAGAADGAIYALDVRRGRWERLSPALAGNPIYSLAVAPVGRTVVLAGSVGALYRGAVVAGRWRWRLVARTGEGAVSSIVWSPEGNGRALASAFGVWPPVLASHDRGQTWQPASQGLPGALPTQALVALSSSHAQIVLTTMGGGVWERAAGSHWRDISAGLPQRHAMALVATDREVPVTLYAGTMGEGVYAKQGSATWRRLGRGLVGVENTVLALALLKGPPPTLFAGTANGVFRYLAPR